MPPQRKREKVKGWLLRLFPSKKTSNDGSGGFFENAEHVVVNDSNMTYVRGDQHNNYTVNMQGDHNAVTQVMTSLSEHIMQDVAYDSSARTPPPRCHPETRVNLFARVTAWFEGLSVPELLLWITGPAGIGKSAIVQTFAEYLARSESLGASLFISRLNKRNNPNQIFITIAYQLATRIEAYRDYVVERISRDPQLLRGGMEAQFATFIVEPFVKRKIGAGGKRWGILLDGFDELRGEDAQFIIIDLISTFSQEHSDTPLIWMIASRDESHLSNKFDDDDVRRSCWKEYIPIDSTEAREDVDRFLRSSFKAIQKKYQQSLPRNWPNATDFLTLTAAASGLFVYAQVVMEFIRDPDPGNPALRFENVISVLGSSNAVPTQDNPFVRLDELYHVILSSIPTVNWADAKLLLGLTVHEIRGLRLQSFRTLRGMSVLFSLSQNSVYASLIKCRSALRIPEWNVAHEENLIFLHTSFADYVKDSRRSMNFYVGDISDIERVVTSNFVRLWKECSGEDIAPALIESTFLQHCSRGDGDELSSVVAKLHTTLFNDIVHSIATFPMTDRYQLPLLDVHMAKLCYYVLPEQLAKFVNYERGLSSHNKKLSRKTPLGSLKFKHLDCNEMVPVKAFYGKTGEGWTLRRPDSDAELKTFVSELEGIQRESPEFSVVVFGGVPNGRVVTFVYRAENGTGMYYVIPYPE